MKIQPKAKPASKPFVQIEIPEPTLDECDFPEDREEPGYIVEVRVIGPAPNPAYVFANLDGRKIPVLCPRRNGAKQTGKTVRVMTGVNEAGETTYILQP